MFFFLDINEFYYYNNIAFIDFFDPFTLYDDFFFNFFFSFLPNDELTCLLYLLDDFELVLFLLLKMIFCCDNVFLLCFYVFLSFILRYVKPLCAWFLVYCWLVLPLCRFLCKVICYFFFILFKTYYYNFHVIF